MKPSGYAPEGLQRYLEIVRKHRRIAIVAVLAVPIAAFAYSMLQAPTYEASSEVLLGRQNIAASLTGLQDPNGYQLSDRPVQTQADLARVPDVVQRTLKKAKATDLTIGGFLASSSVVPKTNSDLLEFTVVNRDPFAASRLATEYAKQFTRYRLALDTTPVRRARAQLQARIRQLRRTGEASTRLYSSLLDKEQALATFEALQTSNAYVVRTAGGAVQISPRPKRALLLGAGFGVLLALALVAIAHALDTRVSTVSELEDKLGLPLLARIPAPPHGYEGALIMRVAPSDPRADAYRVLRANLDFVNRERGARVVMATSAIEGEGKSTTVANLALAYALEGKRVIVLDLDLRRPAVASLLDVPSRPGVVEVVVRNADLSQVLHPVTVSGSETVSLGVVPAGGGAEDIAVRTDVADRWTPASATPTRTKPSMAVGEVVASDRLRALIQELRQRADLVLVDAPPLLVTSDAITLGSIVDAIVLVAEIDRLRLETLDDVIRALSMCAAPTLGWVASGAPATPEYESYASANGRV